MKTPRPYQVTAIERAIDKNLLIGDDRGLGKTLVAIETIKGVWEQSRTVHYPALIICSKQLHWQWFEEIRGQDNIAHIMNFDTKTVIGVFKSQRIYVLTNYQSVIKHVDMLAKSTFSTIVCDEAHRLRNRKSKSAQAVKKLKATRKLALTGTSFDKNPAEIWSILNWLDPKTYRSYWNFYNAHTDVEYTFSGFPKVLGVLDPVQFAQAVKPNMIQRAKRDVAPQLPEKIIQHIPIELTPAQYSLYRTIKSRLDPCVVLDDLTELMIKNKLAEIVRLQQVTTDPRLLEVDIESAKIEWLRVWLDESQSDTLLIFTRFRDTALRIAAEFNIPAIVGGITLDNPAAHPIIVGTIDAMAEGFNFGHIWHTVFIDSHWSSLKMQQAFDRTERDLNADRGRHIMYLEAMNTVDQLVRKTLEQKWSTAQLVQAYLKETPA